MRSIALVGVDGSGKSTQAELLERALAAQNKRVVTIHPFGWKWLRFLRPIARRIRPADDGRQGGRGAQMLAAVLEMTDLAAYIWAAHIWCAIIALFSGRDMWLVSDRSFDDVLIKHKRLGSFPISVLRRLRRLAPGAATTIWLQTEPDVAMQRDREFEPQYYQELNGYYAAAAQEQEWQTISTSHRSTEAIAADIAGVLLQPAGPEPISGAVGG